MLLALVSAGSLGATDAAAPAGSAISSADAACSLPHEQLVRVWTGVKAGRSGEIQIVPKAPNYVSAGLSHNGPWDSMQRVPMFLYGPGFVEAQGSVERAVTMADVAPTMAELLEFDFDAPDGAPLHEALVPAADRPDPPRLILVVVWDGAGKNVLDRWPGAWPNLTGLIPAGTWYANARDGSSPSVTTPVHATLGSGAFPMRHGQIDSQVRGPGGGVIDAWSLGPKLMLTPTLADLYDVAMGNAPKVGILATESRHLGMIGRGSYHPGGDRDIAVVRRPQIGFSWFHPRPIADHYTLPEYVNSIGGIAEDKRALDQQDGKLDGRWRDNMIEALDHGFATPARLPYQTRILLEVLSREEFGADEVPDLFFLNYKIIDGASHRFGMNTLEERDSVEGTDRVLPEVLDFLDAEVGEGEWVVLLTADHGVNPDLPASTAFPIGVERLASDLAARFDDSDGVKVVQKIRPTQIFVNVKELNANGHTLDQMAAFLNGYTEGQSASRATASVATPGERVFAAAFPTKVLPTLPCLPEAKGSAGTTRTRP